MRSTGSASKRGSVSARRARRTASSRCALSVRSEPENVSREASNERPIEYSSSAVWKARLSSGPAPSSSSPESRLATPALPAGSCAEPPSKAKETAITGTVCSSTSHASMPFGLTTRCMSTAPALPASASGAKRRPRATAGPVSFMDGNAPGSGWVLRRLADEIAGDRSPDVEVLPRRRVDRVDGDGVDRRRPGLRLLPASSRWSARCRASGRARWRCPRHRWWRRAAGAWRRRPPPRSRRSRPAPRSRRRSPPRPRSSVPSPRGTP